MSTLRTIIILKGGKPIFESSKGGVAPLIEVLDSGLDTSGAEVWDKVVGMAAAFVYVKLGVERVKADVMSSGAMRLLESNGIKTECCESALYIENRTHTDKCPMEKAVEDSTTPEEAIKAIRKVLESTQAREVK